MTLLSNTTLNQQQPITDSIHLIT